MSVKKFLFYLLFLSSFLTYAAKIKLTGIKTSQDNKISFTIEFKQKPGEYTYHNSLTLSCDSPAYQIDSWEVSPQPTEQFDFAYHSIKKILKNNFTINGTLTQQNNAALAQLAVGYQTNKSTGPQLVFLMIQQKDLQQKNKTGTQETSQKTSAQEIAVPHLGAPETCPAPHKPATNISNYIQKLIATHSSWSLRILLVILLGILMSLTPCIYPMIPITIGILHSNRRAPWWYHLARSSCYTLGIALMFAILGLTAALTGSLFGAFLQHPLVIIVVILFLLYLAFSLFGWYELYVPRFIVRKKEVKPSGTCLSAFVFGFASGTIASPCLSPGLAFLLSIVIASGNKVLGFILLFAFGVGMSIPLVLIGTFAPIINYLPTAGNWMNEIKKVFGLLLIALSFYFLSMIVPIIFIWWLIGTGLFGTSIYLFVNLYLSAHISAKKHKFFRLLLSILLFIGAIACYWYAIIETRTQHTQALINWSTQYQPARTRAQKENKWLFVDIGTPFCSVCKAIDHCIFNQPTIAPLINAMIPVYIDASSSSDYQEINKLFHVIGVPTILIINPYNQKLKQRFGAELYSTNIQDIRSAFQELVTQPPTPD